MEIAEAVLIAGPQFAPVNHGVDHYAKVIGTGHPPMPQNGSRQITVLQVSEMAEAFAKLLAGNVLRCGGGVALRTFGRTSWCASLQVSGAGLDR